jgi:anti-sigma regulatory factor (Ser/Thr protein kinase)
LVVDQFPFVCDPACVPAARGWLASSLGKALSERPRAGPVIGDAVLIASELVTNAVNAECARGVLSWQLGEDEVMVSVVDDGAGWPTVRHPGVTEAHGRGLRIVRALAAEMGIREVERGKQVWATLTL